MEKMTFTKTKRATAIVDIETQWEVDKAHVYNLVASGMTMDEALEDSMCNNMCTQLNYDCEVDEVVYEHEVSIEID